MEQTPENTQEEIKAGSAEQEQPQEGNPYQNTTETPVKRKSKRRRVGQCLTAVGIAVCSFLCGMAVNAMTLDSELHSLMGLKNRIQKSYYEDVSDEEFYNVVFEAVNEKLLDEYSNYLSPDEYEQTLTQAKGKQIGVGLVFPTGMTGIEQLRVSRVCGNSPAESAGIVAGEYLVGFGATQTQMSQEQTFDAFASFLENYNEDETFYVKILGVDGVERILALAKRQYVENYVFYRTNTKSYRFVGEKAITPTEKGQPLTALDNDTAYIRLTQFNGAAANEFGGAMSLFKQQNKKNLVLDLRGNGGGYLDVMLQIASYFCKDSSKRKPVVAIADYGDYQEKFSAPKNIYDEYFGADSRITVLADSQTASASECLIGCMIDYKTISYGDICIAERNGVAKTFGKGIMQSTYTLIGGLRGDAVKLTTARICWPVSQTCIHARGVLPDDGALTVQENIDDEKELVSSIEKLFA